jgi:hypothetical protein
VVLTQENKVLPTKQHVQHVSEAIFARTCSGEAMPRKQHDSEAIFAANKSRLYQIALFFQRSMH